MGGHKERCNALVEWSLNRMGGSSMDNTEQPANADAARRPKPLLTVEQQMAHMKEKGIIFDLCSEEEAAKHLREKC